MPAHALILIDIQKGFNDEAHWGGGRPRNNLDMEENTLALLAHARAQGWKIVHIRHASTEANSPLNPKNLGHAYKDGFEPKAGEVEILKSVNSSFIGTHLEAFLRNEAISEVYICGISTEHCVSTTTRMAGNLGFNVKLVGDACHAWPYGRFSAEEVHEMELALLDGEFCKVVRTRDVIHAN